MEGTAVVIGAGMGGLAAARVLSRRYAAVTVVDRDTLPAGAEPRRGVPQGPHAHVLLVSGLRVLAGLFPDLEDELLAAGATRFDFGTGMCTYRYGRRWPAEPTGLELTSLSRPKLEAMIRARVGRETGVTIRDGVAATALTGSGDAVTGLVLDTGETLPADLVVDCSGQGSRSDRWLAALGLRAPRQVEVKIGVSYTSRVYRRRPGDLEGWRAALVLPDPPHENRSGLVLPIEDGRWLVSVGGWHVDPVPGVEAFTAYAKSLPDPIVAGVMERAEPLGDPLGFRYPSSRRRLFEELDPLPAGYVALGDAVCSFNPIYGQGMTVAAMEAVALGEALDRHGSASAAAAGDFYRAAAEVIAVPWRFSVGADFAYPQTAGPRPRGTRVTNWYARRFAVASQSAPELNRAFYRVQQLVGPPRELFSPAVVARALRPGVPRLGRSARGRTSDGPDRYPTEEAPWQ
ncbi:tryptophan 7-halogenase [Actinoplanes sp. NPDC049118]|uniref:FAD-dependent oxidoreductase n=1 Tax=Actinoplanes sp. NPDC049118 TaxID=3155769 RepID=UPI0033CE072A